MASRVGCYLRQHHVALLALFIALGGTSYAAFKLPKNSVGTKQLKNNAVTASKIKNGAVTGAKVNLGTLSHVPSAITANTANFATNADSATNASNAAHATNADQLGGSSPSAFHDRCPSGTTRAAADLCVTTTDVGTAGSGENSWLGAVKDCAALGLRLPSPAEAFLLVSTTPENPAYWTDDTDTTSDALTFTHDSNTPAGRVTGIPISQAEHVRCVTTPAN